MYQAGNPYLRGRISTFDLLVLASLDQMLLTLKLFILFYTKQPILMRSTGMGLPHELVFPVVRNATFTGYGSLKKKEKILNFRHRAI